ncbi:MAG: hypothetical protein LBO63_05960 [Oscillospiraceae bacterium]|jgi:hypothetical protein|nr:hypothetical protein [Oscillospiraceae bacterium]
MFAIAAKLRFAALLSACAAGGYFFQSFVFVGDAALSVPLWRVPPDFFRV